MAADAPVFELADFAQQDDGRVFVHARFWRSGVAASMNQPPDAQETFHLTLAGIESRMQPVLYTNPDWVMRQDGGMDYLWVEVDGDWQRRIPDPAVHRFVQVNSQPPPVKTQITDEIKRHMDHILAYPELHKPDFSPNRVRNKGFARDLDVRIMLGKKLRKRDV